MSLSEYNKKRDFNKTSEPKGKVRKNGKEKIFAVQLHSARRLHYDFRLQWRGAMLSWAVPKGFSFNPKDKRLAVKVEDHPIDYASFEGVIPKGEYGAGPVMLWDRGTYVQLSSFDKGLKNGVLKFELFGVRLKGKWSLIRVNTDDDSWLLIKEKDEFTSTSFTLPETSIKTGRNLQEIKDSINAKPIPFTTISPELATLTTVVPDTHDWLNEIKYDGYRILTYAENGKVSMMSRNNHNFTLKFNVIATNLENLSINSSFVLDGEVISLNSDGKSDFQLLQNQIRSKNTDNLVYMVFDILALNGQDLRDCTLIERKEILKKFFKKIEKSNIFNIKNVDFIIGNGKNCFDAVKTQGLEGLVSKRIDSKYVSKRTEDWLKIKCVNLQEFIIIGYTKTDKKEYFSSLLLATHEEDTLIFVGSVGTGFNKAVSKELYDKFLTIKSANCPIEPIPKVKEKVQWLKPQLVANIQYMEFTRDGLLRHASFKGLRIDKAQNEVVIEKPKNIKNNKKSANLSKNYNFNITNPEKIVFPEKNITKIDIINYYKAISTRMLKYMSNRLLSVVRCHGGVGANCFYKKHPKSNPYVKTKVVDDNEYFYIDSENALLYEAQLGTIEFHEWGSTVNKIDKPDIMVFDLDPDENMNIDTIRQGVKDLRKILKSLKLKSYLKTSGGKGYHIVVPIKADFNWDEFEDFSRKVAEIMQAKYPDKYTTNIRKNMRKNKIFIDYLRNSKSATSVCPYSIRARENAPVSMPIAWSELDKIKPNEINIFEAMKRLKKRDPWQDFFK